MALRDLKSPIHSFERLQGAYTYLSDTVRALHLAIRDPKGPYIAVRDRKVPMHSCERP